jgi:hypothetical protein
MEHVKLYENFLNEKVSNTEILDLVENIQALITKLQAEDSKRGEKLFTIAGPLVKELHSYVK